jgi:hypothetical protein
MARRGRARCTWALQRHGAWGAERFDQVDKDGQPVARGIDGQLLWPQEHIIRFLKRLETGSPAAHAVASGDTLPARAGSIAMEPE